MPRTDGDYGRVTVHPTNPHAQPVQYGGARYTVHLDGDLSIHTRQVDTAAIWARGQWQRVEASPL